MSQELWDSPVKQIQWSNRCHQSVQQNNNAHNDISSLQ